MMKLPSLGIDDVHGNDGELELKNRLKAARAEQGLSQTDLARLVGVSRQTISSLEKGRYNPSILLAFKIARRFGLQIEDVFIYQEEDHE